MNKDSKDFLYIVNYYKFSMVTSHGIAMREDLLLDMIKNGTCRRNNEPFCEGFCRYILNIADMFVVDHPFRIKGTGTVLDFIMNGDPNDRYVQIVKAMNPDLVEIFGENT